MEGQAPNLEELQQNLGHQLALYRQLVDVLREEKEHIIGVQLKELRDCTYAKEAILDEIHRSEFRRKKWVSQSAVLLGVPEAEISIEYIAKKVASSAQNTSLVSIKLALLHLIKRAREMNAENKALVESALKDAQQLKRNILGLSSDQPQVYGPKGNMGSSTREQGARFLSKEA